MVQPHSWTDEVVGQLRNAGLVVTPAAAAALGKIVARGRTSFDERDQRDLVEPDFAVHVDELAARLIEQAKGHSVDTLSKDTISKLFGWLCPGFFPWC